MIDFFGRRSDLLIAVMGAAANGNRSVGATEFAAQSSPHRDCCAATFLAPYTEG